MSSQQAEAKVKLVTCGNCRGSGWIIRDIEKPAERCTRCGGKGRNEKIMQRPLITV